jgi:hypothetical protein
MRIKGAEPEAELMLTQFCAYAADARGRLLESVPGLKREEEDLRARADRLRPDGKGAGLFMGTGLAVTDVALDWHKKGDLRRRAAICRSRWEALEEQAQEWLEAAEYAQSLTQLIAGNGAAEHSRV